MRSSAARTARQAAGAGELIFSSTVVSSHGACPMEIGLRMEIEGQRRHDARAAVGRRSAAMAAYAVEDADESTTCRRRRQP